MINYILSWLVVGLFAIWFIVSVFNQNNKWRKWISFILKWDIVSYVPIWTFFAPNPGRTDIYLLYRDRDAEGNISGWQEIKTVYRKTWYHQWSLKRRIHKGIVDLSPNFTKDRIVEPKRPVSKRHVLEFPYLLFLNYVCGKPADFRAQLRQFAIARTNGHETEDQLEVIFLSAFHKIDFFN